jgi:hypothetical protein
MAAMSNANPEGDSSAFRCSTLPESFLVALPLLLLLESVCGAVAVSVVVVVVVIDCVVDGNASFDCDCGIVDRFVVFVEIKGIRYVGLKWRQG